MSIKMACCKIMQIIPCAIQKLFGAWLTAAAIEYWLLPANLRNIEVLDGIAHMSFGRVCIMTCAIALALFVLSRFCDTGKIERILILLGGLASVITALIYSFTWSFLIAGILVIAVLGFFAVRGYNDGREVSFPQEKATAGEICAVIILTALFFSFVCVWTLGRVYSFNAPTFDFGIFSQMFYSMKSSGLQITTVERDRALSHFSVHVSPIWYLLLPFYCLFPSPATLQVLQAGVISSAVIPLWKLGKRYGLSKTGRVLLCAVLFFYPAFSGGTGWDIHENCFLTPLLLWLIYGIDEKRSVIIFFAAFLTLMVKEDAAIYVAVIALYLIIKTVAKKDGNDVRDIIVGGVMLIVAVIWFYATTKYLAIAGDGVMTNRYMNLMYDGSFSLMTVIKTIVMSPIKAVYECVAQEKTHYIIMTLLPLLGLPILTRRYERYVLLIPYILINLMPDYEYQHSIFFQYSFGTTALLIYVSLRNLAELNFKRKEIILALASVISAVCFCTNNVPKAIQYPVQIIEERERLTKIEETLSTVPDDATVAATTYYTTFLSQRDTLYDIRYCSVEHLLQAEYIVLKGGADYDYNEYAVDGEENGYEEISRLITENGYVLFNAYEDEVLIYKKI